MAKINLLTYHHSLSYGATMQAYATCKKLKELGHEVRIINLQNKKKTSLISILTILKKIKFKIFKYKYFPKKTKKMYAPDYRLMPKADWFMVGSDQVWNPLMTKDHMADYFFSFLPDDSKRISYASSFGISEPGLFSQTQMDSIKSLLAKFTHVSVRENSGVDMCKNEFNIDATQVLDPTLLLSSYDEIIGDITNKNEIVCFFIDFKSNAVKFSKIIEFIKSELNLPVTLLDSGVRAKVFENHCYIPFMSPLKWIRRLKAANFIITSSFHGLAFALIFNKPFVALQANPKLVTRIKSLLSLLHLEDRLVIDYADIISKKDILHQTIDYNSVNSLLDNERQKSLEFLGLLDKNSDKN